MNIWCNYILYLKHGKKTSNIQICLFPPSTFIQPSLLHLAKAEGFHQKCWQLYLFSVSTVEWKVSCKCVLYFSGTLFPQRAEADPALPIMPKGKMSPLSPWLWGSSQVYPDKSLLFTCRHGHSLGLISYSNNFQKNLLFFFCHFTDETIRVQYQFVPSSVFD